MALTTSCTLAGLLAAALLAGQLGGAPGAGALAGYLVGAAVTGFGVARQRSVLRSAPARALRSMVEGFLLKLAALALCTLVLVALEPLRTRLDLKSFLLAFAAAVLVVLLPGTWDNARLLSARLPLQGRPR